MTHVGGVILAGLAPIPRDVPGGRWRGQTRLNVPRTSAAEALSDSVGVNWATLLVELTTPPSTQDLSI
jgi:hypothetical protein